MYSDDLLIPRAQSPNDRMSQYTYKNLCHPNVPKIFEQILNENFDSANLLIKSGAKIEVEDVHFDFLVFFY